MPVRGANTRRKARHDARPRHDAGSGHKSEDNFENIEMHHKRRLILGNSTLLPALTNFGYDRRC